MSLRPVAIASSQAIRVLSVTPHMSSASKQLSSATSGRFAVDDRVEYHPVGGPHRTATSTGTIRRVLDHPEIAGSAGNMVHASADDLRYEIENEKTGKMSAVKEGNIERVL